MDNLIVWFSALGVPTILSGVTMLLVNRHYLNKDKNKNTTELNERRIAEIEQKFNNFKEHQDEYHTKMEENVENSFETLNKADSTMKILSEALQALLRDRMVELYHIYYDEKHFMPIYAKESLDGMYVGYKALNGNGVIDELVKAMRTLPPTPTEIKSTKIER